MVFSTNKRKRAFSVWLVITGLAIVVFTHVWMLSSDSLMSPSELFVHSWINLFAAVFVLLGWALERHL